MIKVAICDDDKSICTLLEDILTSYSTETTIGYDVDVFYNAEGLLRHISKGTIFDIIFIDIEMDDINGIKAGMIIRKDINNLSTLIIYISSHQNYAMKLFDIRPFNFIVKPLNTEKVKSEFNSALKHISDNNKMFRFKINSRYVQLLITDIMYFESNNRKITIVTTSEKYEYYDQLDTVSKTLSSSLFVLIHRSFLVNYNQIKSFTYEEVAMTNGTVLSISQNKRKDVRKLLMHLTHED